ncbi:DUF3744 domain-containing protein [Aerococcaceae bacterium DSM 111020]|nr:DUF3744 domain-containing protein [Aerococcaceae bacterium DSM 111020]
MKTAKIEFEHFTFRYDSQAEPNLRDISFQIGEGETVLIVGPSGSGKSTIGKAINGQIPHRFRGEYIGEVQVNGQLVKDIDIANLSLMVGTVLQDSDGQFVGLTVAEDIAFALENDAIPQKEMHQRVGEWAKILELDLLLNNRPQDLSGGQKQRVSICGVMINEVPILIFDEPLANLDPKTGQEMILLINQLSQRLRLTTIIIEHRLEECLLADIDRVLVISEGKLKANLGVDALLRSSILEETGLRLPLYLDVLKKTGFPLENIPHLNAYEKTALPDEAIQAVDQWAQGLDLVMNVPDNAFICEVVDVSFKYIRQLTPSLRAVDFSIRRGEMVSIVGTNGAGKSTIAKLLCGFERPESGHIKINGQNIASLSIKEIADTVGYVMQNPNAMISKITVYEEVALGLLNRNVSEQDIQEKVAETLKICGLYEFRNWPISALSYGQKRRVSIAAVLVLDPEILILDEPTAGQDYQHYTEMMEFLRYLNESFKTTILMITHDMHLMQEYTDRVLVFDAGRLIADTKPRDLFNEQDILEHAHLVPTSLYQLGEALPNTQADDFLEQFIAYERGRGIE